MLTRRRLLVALLVTPWALWALVRTFGLDAVHPLVSLMAFTPWAAATAIVPVVVALVAREWGLAALAALALVAFAGALAPRALDGPQLAGETPAGRRLVVMSANLRFGQADAASVMALVRRHDVDLLALLELSPGAIDRLDAAGALTLLPGRVLAPGVSDHGIGLMARRSLTAIGVPNPEQGRLQADLLLSDVRPLRVVAVHPSPPITGQRVGQWRTNLRQLPGPADGGAPTILLGDFNATLDNRELRRVIDRGYTDAADATGMGLRPTFPVGRPIPPITIDHVLVPREIEVHRLSVHEIRGSDHRALIAELVLAPG